MTNVTNMLEDWVTANERLCKMSPKEVYAKGMKELKQRELLSKLEAWLEENSYNSFDIMLDEDDRYYVMSEMDSDDGEGHQTVYEAKRYLDEEIKEINELEL